MQLKVSRRLMVTALNEAARRSKDAPNMTTQALTQISYSNAYSTVLSTGAVGISHPAHGWARIIRAVVAKTIATARAYRAAHAQARAQHQAAQSASRVLRVAAALQATQPGLASELVAIASRDR
jgi:hypothetical protein